MSFKEILAKLNRATCEEISAPQMAVMQKASLMLRRSGILNRCLQLGESAPDFTFTGARGTEYCLHELLAQGPVVVSFFRGDWCDFCTAELKAYGDIGPQLTAMGASFLAISPEQPCADEAVFPDGPRVQDKDNAIGHTFGIVYTLSQEFREILQSWDLNLPKIHSCEKWELPLAATYVIDKDRRVVFSHVEVDFRKRFDPAQILTQLARL